MTDKNKNIGTCSNALSKLTDLLQEGLGSNKIEELIRQYPDCEELILDQLSIWDQLQTLEVPEPSAAMDVGFYRTLNEWSQKAHSDSKSKKSDLTISRTLLQQIAVAASLFLGGLFIGRYFLAPSNQPTFVAVESVEQSDDLFNYAGVGKKVSATDKLLALQEIKENENPSAKVIEAMYHALMHDRNTNVRLSAIETLVYFADEPKVRELLIEAIPHQDSPLVQVALANATLLLQEKRSSEAWQQLLDSDVVEPDIKIHLQKTLETIL